MAPQPVAVTGFPGRSKLLLDPLELPDRVGKLPLLPNRQRERQFEDHDCTSDLVAAIPLVLY